MFDISKHPYFEEYIDPKTGVKSYILTERVGFAQQHFYFTNTSVTHDGKYLWIRYINPPALVCNLAVVSLDPENPFIRSFPAVHRISRRIPHILSSQPRHLTRAVQIREMRN